MVFKSFNHEQWQREELVIGDWQNALYWKNCCCLSRACPCLCLCHTLRCFAIPIVCLEHISFTNSQVTRSSAGCAGLMATQSVPIPLITGKTPNSSNYDHGNDNQDYRDDDHEYPDDDCDDDNDDQTTMTYRSFPITDCRHAPERAHLPGLESTMCRKVRQKGTKYHSCVSNIKNLDI